MDKIKLSRDDIERLVCKTKDYFNEELSQDIGGFEAEFLIDFIAKEIGPHYYNRGLLDAMVLFTEKNDELSYLIHEQEMPTS